MPYIDTAKIEGFDGMTAEEKVSALLGFEIPETVDMTKYVEKTAFDKKASETANLSRQLKDTVPASEVQKLQERIAEMEKREKIAEYRSKYLEQGYDKDLASETAQALVDGDMAKVFENGEKHKTALEKKIKEDLINGTQKPGGTGAEGKGVDPAIEKAKALAKAKNGGEKTYAEIMSNYKK